RAHRNPRSSPFIGALAPLFLRNDANLLTPSRKSASLAIAYRRYIDSLRQPPSAIATERGTPARPCYAPPCAESLAVSDRESQPPSPLRSTRGEGHRTHAACPCRRALELPRFAMACEHRRPARSLTAPAPQRRHR